MAMSISTHTPLARRDRFMMNISTRIVAFLLTRLLRGVTGVPEDCVSGFEISTHTPLARRDPGQQDMLGLAGISTHTPLARRDFNVKCFRNLH